MIPNKILDKKEVNKLLINKVFSGSEAIICESDNPFTLYKVFTKGGIIQPMGKNKEKKIELLHQLQLDYSVKPIRTISYNDIVIGYEMTSDYSFDSYKLYQFTKDDLYIFLEKTKDILEYFSNKGIVYGDVEPRNILFNRETKEIQFCDMDNIQIGDLMMDVIPYNLCPYDYKYGIDDGVHSYMHNIMTLKAFNLDIYFSSRFSINRHFKRGAKKVILSMQDDEIFTKEYLIKYIKKHK